MHLNKPSLYWVYLKDYCLVSGLLSLLFWYFTWLRGPGALSSLILIKILLSLLTYYIHSRRKRQEVYFYLNNGISAREFLMVGIISDIMIWAIVSTLIIQIFW